MAAKEIPVLDFAYVKRLQAERDMYQRLYKRAELGGFGTLQRIAFAVSTLSLVGLGVTVYVVTRAARPEPVAVVHTVPVVVGASSVAPRRILSPYIPPEFDGCDLDAVRCRGSRMQDLDGTESELVISCTCKEAR